jgi:hypothetical protein
MLQLVTGQFAASEFATKRLQPPIVSIVVTASYAKVGLEGAAAERDERHGSAVCVITKVS